MNGLILVLTLCGIPQYVFISSGTTIVEGTPKQIFQKIHPNDFSQMYKSDFYQKRTIEVDKHVHMVCA